MKFSFIRECIHMIGSGFSFIPGLWFLSRLHQPIVTIFGGKDVGPEDHYAKMAYELGNKLVQFKFSVITGGGSGIMMSAHCGAASVHKERKEIHKWTLGISVQGVNGDVDNPCCKVVAVPHFFVRKWLLMHYSVAYIIFPGGIGTVDEFFETLDLMRNKKITARPVILIGKEYWHSLLDWYNNSAKKFGLITPAHEAPFIITDDIDEVLKHVVSSETLHV